MWLKLLVIFVLFDVILASSESQSKLIVKAADSYIVGKNVHLEVYLSEPVNVTVPVSLFCKGNKCTKIFKCESCNNQTIPANSNESLIFDLEAFDVGIVTLIFNTTAPGVDFKRAYLTISVGHSSLIVIISYVVGWIYFSAWSISFYPQVWTNYKRKSVVGLNFDFLGLNITGFLFYSIFNICLKFYPSYQDAYHNYFKYSKIPVELNDVGFSVHAVILTGITIIQCFIYERGNQRLSYTARILLVLLWSAAGVMLILAATQVISKLFYVYYLSYAKLGITILKYTPQAWYNFKRKSTVGWSIGNVLLDFTGGIFSLLQMFLDSYNYDDWSNIFGNFTKFGLGMISISFDILFILQHYACYPHKKDEESDLIDDSVQTNTKQLNNEGIINKC
ncbi:cystinosin-like protein [Dinothrombium tinctorium]|uniref:Cystinosin-like protein n=1 Tax=Dinothrombium tinctorium TaxID=1965070 RepID=A0A443RHT2_9ACAR|nr:cystinosin-like protein [Dinothrombium tinctorium]